MTSTNEDNLPVGEVTEARAYENTKDNTQEVRNPRSTKCCCFAVLGFFASLSAIIGVSISLSSQRTSETSVEGFCDQFGITDSRARAILENTEDVFRTNRIFEELLELTCIPENAFTTKGLERLVGKTSLTFRDCPIKAIHPNAFDRTELEDITGLSFDNTDLRTLPEGVFRRFINLRFISLEENHFTVLEEDIFGIPITTLSSITFEGSLLLRELPEFVRKQTSIAGLDISDTQIDFLEDNFFVGFENLNGVTIFDTPLEDKNTFLELELSGVESFKFTGRVDNTFCGIFSFGDRDARFDVRAAVVRGLNASTESLVVRQINFFTDVCFPIDSFKEVKEEEIEIIKNFTQGSLTLINDEIQLHPLAFIDDEIFLGFTSLILDMRVLESRKSFEPNQFETFRNLKHFEIRNLQEPNQIEVNILGDQCNLESFSAINTFLHQPPSFLSECKDLRILDLRENSRMLFLNPRALAKLENLEQVILTGTPLLNFFTTTQLAESIGVEESAIVV